MNSAFDTIVSGKSARLVEAALEFAADAYPNLDTDCYLHCLNQLAQRLCETCEGKPSPPDRLEALNEFFYGTLGFVGNRTDYYDARNSYLNEVLDRRQGIPISLSVIYQDLARAVGLNLYGVNLPGHFMLGMSCPVEGLLYIDVFNGGELLTWPDCLERVGQMMACPIRIEESDLQPMTNGEILVRMLRNLKGIYSRSSTSSLLYVQRRLLMLRPNDPIERRDLGIVLYRQGQLMESLRLLERLVQEHPDSKNDELVLEYLSLARHDATLIN
ncbi:hypothetical protein Pan216_33420 [Planctomycetes bacterium Pan216]|uniref:Protein SirB1 N-terminal domain-containing protein n=1 Tax=Kolteria novifilia TaxID=2527975 RepID=A0A518B672_9BACT|nr:hypothetical protein Pan216_33420 [Planctomycetes bacterium Pan216]